MPLLKPRLVPRLAKWTDERLGAAKVVRKALDKIFPDHWSFMLGEIALYCFVILVATGRLPDLLLRSEPVAHGVPGQLRAAAGRGDVAGLRVGIRLTFDVRAGLVMRQAHHWAALLFSAAIVAHLLRVFFTGAFRRPAEINWVIGLTMMILAHHQRLLRLLAARRPAVGLGPAHRVRRRAVDPVHRHVDRLAVVRRRVPRRRPLPALLRAAHPDRAGRPRRADRPAPGHPRPPQAHPLPGAGPARRQRGRRAAVADLRGQGHGAAVPHRRPSCSCWPAWPRSTRSGSTARTASPT